MTSAHYAVMGDIYYYQKVQKNAMKYYSRAYQKEDKRNIHSTLFFTRLLRENKQLRHAEQILKIASANKMLPAIDDELVQRVEEEEKIISNSF